jgi:hypothetical protein
MKRFAKAFYRFALRVLPETRAVDNFIAFMTFVRAHRRLPTNKALFNDVLYRIKTTDEITDPLRVFVSDKEFVKFYVKAIVGEQFNVPTIAVLHSMEEVRRYQFPSDCCIKPTHMSAKVILRRQNSAVDLEEIETWFNSTHYLVNREANYKTLKHKVIVEPLIFDGEDLLDYKIFCYEGRSKLIQVDVDRHIGHARKFYDTRWNELPFSLLYPRSTRHLERPGNLEEMLSVARSLSSHFDFVRVDLYSNGDKCLVGEITNCHGNAWESFMPKSGEKLASDMIFGRD